MIDINEIKDLKVIDGVITTDYKGSKFGYTYHDVDGLLTQIKEALHHIEGLKKEIKAK